MDLDKFLNDNSKSCVVQSAVPEATKNKPCWLGIDEAGRGPVLGPMVYGTCYSPIIHKEKFKEMGFADSKTLSEEERETRFETISHHPDIIGWMVDILSPNFISTSMLRRSKYNLNALSHDSAIGLIQKVVDQGANIQEVYVDTVGDPSKYQAKLKNIFPDIDITVAKKADSTYPIVSAASICAKVCRDHIVKQWVFPERLTFEEGEYGSGYPSEEKTKKFLIKVMDNVFGFPQFVRFSWSTASKILDESAALVNWEDDDEEGEKPATKKRKAASMQSFFVPKAVDKSQEKHRYFKERRLTSLGDI